VLRVDRMTSRFNLANRCNVAADYETFCFHVKFFLEVSISYRPP